MNKQKRLQNIFQDDGKTFIVAMDHGTFAGAMPGLENPAAVIEKVRKGGADAVIANVGLVKRFSEELKGLGIILRLDIGPTVIGEGHSSRLLFGPEMAVKCGADAVIVNGGPGTGVEEETLPNIAAVVEQFDSTGIPVVGEMSPGGFDSAPEYRTLENIVLGARIASELGVDLIKTIYKPGFRKVVDGSFVPVVVLGGAKTDNTVDFLDSIADAIKNGASGVAIGRNVWGHPNPEKMAGALSAIIHKNMSGAEASEYVRG